jgi:hypothetical protein
MSWITALLPRVLPQLSGLVPRLGPLAAAGGVIALLAFSGGVWVRGSFCDAAKYKAQAESLTKMLKATTENYTRDAKVASANAAKLDQLERAIREAQDKVARADGQCLTADDADGLRKLWRQR